MPMRVSVATFSKSLPDPASACTVIANGIAGEKLVSKIPVLVRARPINRIGTEEPR